MGKLPFETIKREVWTKKEAVGTKLGKTQDIINYGIVNIDKPRGPTQ